MKNYFLVENKKIFFQKFGDGPPIILLHGISNSSKTWNNISKKLSKIRTVYLIDFRGHGNSDHFDNYEWINFSNDIVAFIEKNIDSKVEIIGHSLGACVATKVSQILKTNIKALILEDPPFFTHKRQGEKGISQRFQHNLHLSKIFNSKNKILEKLKNNSKLSNVKNLELISENLANLDYKVLEATINGEALKSFHPEEILPEISGIRTLLLAGDEIKTGGVITSKEIKKIKSIMNNLEVIHLKEIGHNIHDEIPEEFENIVFNFLDNG